MLCVSSVIDGLFSSNTLCMFNRSLMMRHIHPGNKTSGLNWHFNINGDTEISVVHVNITLIVYM